VPLPPMRRLVARFLGYLCDRRRSLHVDVIQGSGSEKPVPEGPRVLDRIEFDSHEDFVGVIDATREHVPLCCLLTSGRICIEYLALPLVEVTDVEVPQA
jgi:hypothetical protein